MRSDTLAPLLRRLRRGAFRAATRHVDLVGVIGMTLAAFVMPVVPSTFDKAESARLVQCVARSVRAISVMGQRPSPAFGFEVFAEPRVGRGLYFEGFKAARELEHAACSRAAEPGIDKRSAAGANGRAGHYAKLQPKVPAGGLDQPARTGTRQRWAKAIATSHSIAPAQQEHDQENLLQLHSGASFDAVNARGEPCEFFERRTPIGWLGIRVVKWTYPLFYPERRRATARRTLHLLVRNSFLLYLVTETFSQPTCVLIIVRISACETRCFCIMTSRLSMSIKCPSLASKNAVRPLSQYASTNRIQIGYNIRQLPSTCQQSVVGHYIRVHKI